MNEGLGWWGGARWVGELAGAGSWLVARQKITRKVSNSVSVCVYAGGSQGCVSRDGWMQRVTASDRLMWLHRTEGFEKAKVVVTRCEECVQPIRWKKTAERGRCGHVTVDDWWGAVV